MGCAFRKEKPDQEYVMTLALRPRTEIHYRSLFPAWEGIRPVGWFFIEQLLEARADSDFPTNSRGPDEDVNIYLAHLLGSWATGVHDETVLRGAEPVLLPPDRSMSRHRQAEHYRHQADHRLLALGLFDRGDLVRRRRIGWQMTAKETHDRDLAAVVAGYDLAANLLEKRSGANPGLTTVWKKLAGNLPGYVHVLQTLARRRLGLGAQLTSNDLQDLLSASAG